MFITQFFRDMRAQKMRTFLTVFGITWGTISVVLLLGFGVGLGRQMKKNFHGMGEGLIILWPGRTSVAFEGLNKGRRLSFREEDALLLQREISGIRHVSPEYARGGVELKTGRSTYSVYLRGVYPVYGEIRNTIPEKGGRFLDELDLRNKRRSIFLGTKVKEELFGEEPAVGRLVLLNSVPFQVVGVLIAKTQNSSYGDRDEFGAFIPASTFSALFGSKTINNIVVQAEDPRRNEVLQKEILGVLAKKLRFHPEDEEAIAVWDMTEGERLFTAFMLGFNIFLGVVGAFTLIVGGIGVSNIMNVVVEERTREIGLKMAVGAKKRFVLSQFLFETLLLTSVGGAAGMAVAYGIIRVFPTSGIEEEIGKPVFSWEVALVTVVLLGLIGFISGFSPARRASNLDPVEALRS